MKNEGDFAGNGDYGPAEDMVEGLTDEHAYLLHLEKFRGLMGRVSRGAAAFVKKEFGSDLELTLQ